MTIVNSIIEPDNRRRIMMKEILEDALKNSKKADYVEIRLEKKESTGIRFQGKKLEKIDCSQQIGGNVRALVKGGWGFITFNQYDDLNEKVQQAINIAALVGKTKSNLAEVPPVIEEVKKDLDKDFRKVSLREKKQLIEHYNKIILNYSPKIQSTNAVYGDSFSTVYYANSEGSYIRQEIPKLIVSFTAIAREKDNVQIANESLGTVEGFKKAEDISSKAELAASRAVNLLKAKPVEGGEYTVVLDQTLGGVFIHEAFGHLSEADFIYEDNRMRNIMKLGKNFGYKKLNVIDDGSIPNLFGSAKYDDEGVKTKKNYLIRNGLLDGRLHSRETAKK